MSTFTFRKDRHRIRRSTRPGHRWPGARGLGCHWHRNTDTSQNTPRNLTNVSCQQLLNIASYVLPTELGHLVLYSPTPPAVVHHEVTGPARAAITRIRGSTGTRGAITLPGRLLRGEYCCSKIASKEIKQISHRHFIDLFYLHVSTVFILA